MPEERRAGAPQRIPFVRRCSLRFAEGTATSAFLVNINVLGAYVELDTMLPLGQPLRCSFRPPGNERELEIEAVVAWNTRDSSTRSTAFPQDLGSASET